METEKEYIKKLEDAEKNFRKEQQRIEEAVDEATHENRKFRRELEELADYIRYVSQNQEYDEPQDLQQAYRMIEHAQEDGNVAVKNTLKKLEDEREEQRLSYRKVYSSYEEEIELLRKERNKKND